METEGDERRSMCGLYKRVITVIKQEGISVALKAVYNLFANKYLNFKTHLLVRYCNLFHHGLVLRKIQGNKMYLSVNDRGLSQELLFHDIREPLQTNLLKQLVTPGMTVVDIGANLGYYVLIEASIIGETGKIYAIEPIPQNYEILKKNVRKNNYENIVETYFIAVSDTCGVSKIAMTKESNFSTMFLNKREMSEWMEKQVEISTEKILDIETVTLDTFLIDKPPVDFIRMDVEGYEAKIIKGMSNTLKNSKKGLKLFIEFHPGIFREPRVIVAEIIQDLINSGLEIKYIVNTEGSAFLDFSPDNILETICSEWAPGVFIEKI